MTVMVCTFVLLLGNLLREIIGLMVNQQVGLFIVIKAIALLIPFVMIYALPIGMLTATLLVFGRFSADQELTAARANGISLVALVKPILLLSVALSLLSAWFNLQVAPECRVAYKRLLETEMLPGTLGALPEDRFIDDFPGFVIYVGKIRGTNLSDIHLYRLKDGEKDLDVRATQGQVSIDPVKKTVQFTLFEAWLLTRNNKVPPPITDTNGVIIAMPATNNYVWQPTYLSEWKPDPLELKKLEKAKAKIKLSDMSFEQLREEKRLREKQGLDTTPVICRLHQQVAFSFACIGFTLIGIPLGVRAHRRETNINIFIALVLMAIYYGFIILGQVYENRPGLAPHLFFWYPNLLFHSVGAWLLWRTNSKG
jgi:lipopolysaccharide export system permease protein